MINTSQSLESRLNFSITQLEYVWAVHKHGHFAKAAEACHITQPTLSMQIHKLEEDLGIVIFDRSKKPILATASGEKLIEQIHKVLIEANKIHTLIESERFSGVQGELIVGIIPTIAPYLLPRLLPELARLYPHLRLKIRELQTHQIIRSLNFDEIDVGILATPLKIGKIHEISLYYEPFELLCQKKHALSKAKKAKYANLTFDDIWLLEEGHCLRNQVLDICRSKHFQPAQRQFQFESGNLETLKSLINTYGGYTLLPSMASDTIGSESCLIRFDRPVPSREIGLVYQRAQYKLPLVEALNKSILTALPDEIRKLRPKDLEVLPVE
jgi:LysR family hydrogen peroxide-inducible transcriptional activator